MILDLLPRFEQVAVARNPLLAGRLQPGLPESTVRALLRKGKVEGDLAQVVELYTWRNGTRLDPEIVASKSGLFPGKAYYFLDLEMALGHLDHGRVAARKRPKLSEGYSYLPVFWDGSTGWITIDVSPSHNNRVLLAEHNDETPFREVHTSFRDFICDAIRAIEANDEQLLHLWA